MSASPEPVRIVRTLLRVFFWLIGAPLFLLALLALLIYLPPIQNVLRTQAINLLERKIGTPVQLEHLAMRYPLGLSLEGLYLQSQNGDTLLFAGSLKARVAMSALMSQRIVISSVELSNARVIVRQAADSTFNFSYIIDAFAGADSIPKPSAKDTTGGWSFAIEEVELESIRGDLDLRPQQLMMALRIGELDLDLEAFDAKQKRFHGGTLAISNTRVDLRSSPGPTAPDSYPLLKNPLAQLDIQVKEVELDQVGFTLMNTARGDSLWLNLASGALYVDSIRCDAQVVALDLLELKAPRFGMVTHGAQKKIESEAAPPWLDQNDAFRFWVRDWNIGVKEVRILDGDLQLHTASIASPVSLFDAQHIAYVDLDLGVRDLVFNNDRIAADVRELNFTGGPNGTQLNAHFRLNATPALVALEDASITAGRNTLDFSASARIGGLSNVYRTPKDVPLVAQLDAQLSLAAWQPVLLDLGISIPQKLITSETWNTHLAFAGTAQQADTLRVDVIGNAGSVIHLKGNATNLYQWPRTTFVADLSQFEMGVGLRQIACAYLPNAELVPTRFIGQLHARGRNGALLTELRFTSDLGNVSGSATANLSTGKLPDAIHADLDITDLRTQRFTSDTTLGVISLHLLADGRGLNSSARSGHLEVIPSTLAFRGNDLSTLRITGDLVGDSIRTQVNVDAANLGLNIDVRGRWPSGADSLAATLAMHVQRMRLQELRITDHSLNVEGDLHGAVSLSTDKFGHFELAGDSIRLSNAKRSFLIDQLIAAGYFGADTTAVILSSDALQMEYTTNMRIDSVVPSMRAKLLSYFRADSSFAPVRGKQMALRVAMPRTEWLTGLVLADLHGFELKTFTGHYDSDRDALDLDIDIPHAEYQRLRVNGFTVHVKAAGSDLNGEMAIGRAVYDSLHVENLLLQAETSPGALLLTLHEHPKDERTHYEIPLEFTRADGGLALHIREGLLLDTIPWTADPQNLLRFTKDGPMAEHFVLQGGAQHVSLLTDAAATHLVLDQYDLGTLLNFIITSDTVPFAAGIATGSVSLPLRGGEGLQVDMEVKDLTIMGTRTGDGSLKARETQGKKYEATAHLVNGENLLDISASVDLGEAAPIVDARTTFDLKDIRFLRPFVSRFA